MIRASRLRVEYLEAEAEVAVDPNAVLFGQVADEPDDGAAVAEDADDVGAAAA
jgi:hypothetical protein